MLTKKILLVLFAMIGLSTSFLLSPALPKQESSKAASSSGAVEFEFAFVDAALDNPGIQADANIEAARKCGFCMGVSFFQTFHA